MHSVFRWVVAEHQELILTLGQAIHALRAFVLKPLQGAIETLVGTFARCGQPDFMKVPLTLR